MVFLLAGITDVLDGHIAREYDQMTDLGAALDPLADKLMAFAVLISFTSKKINTILDIKNNRRKRNAYDNWRIYIIFI